jgi:crotonobetainyl-CoA:carnitine CoA-transferase CaiB-like acyl-CoA transferase
MRHQAGVESASSVGGTFGSLRDLRILDLTQMLAGPFATMILADHGATVVKIEPPVGDVTRGFGPFRDDGSDQTHADDDPILGGYFQSLDRNKESVVLDLKSEAGRAAFRALVRDADAVVENFRAGVMDGLGLSYESLREINPRLVYGAIRGFGDVRTGASPYGQWPAFDVVAQAMGGVMAITGPDSSSPTKIGPGIGDIIPGIYLSFGIVAAIHNARRTGRGQFVDVAMTDAVLAICERALVQNSAFGRVPGPEGNHHPYLCPFGLFPANDGLVAIAATHDEFFTVLCEQLRATELLDDERFASRRLRGANKLALIPLLNEKTRQFSKAELMARIGGKLPFGPVMNVAEAVADPHFAAREMIVEVEQPGGSPMRVAGVPVKMTETPGGVHRRSPLLGEHNELRLAEAGLSASQIAELDAARVGR